MFYCEGECKACRKSMDDDVRRVYGRMIGSSGMASEPWELLCSVLFTSLHCDHFTCMLLLGKLDERAATNFAVESTACLIKLPFLF